MIKEIIKVLEAFSAVGRPATNKDYIGVVILLTGGIGFNIILSFFGSILSSTIPNSELRTDLLTWLIGVSVLSVVVFVLFQFFPKVRLFQAYPTILWTYINGQMSVLLASFWQNWLLIFGIFTACNALYWIVILMYQARTIDSVAHEPDELKYHHLFQPTIVLCFLAACLAGLVRLFHLSNYFILIVIEMFVIALSIYVVYNYYYYIFHSGEGKDKKEN